MIKVTEKINERINFVDTGNIMLMVTDAVVGKVIEAPMEPVTSRIGRRTRQLRPRAVRAGACGAGNAPRNGPFTVLHDLAKKASCTGTSRSKMEWKERTK